MKSKVRAGVICIVLLLGTGMAPRPAGAGFCAGDAARAAKLMEYFSFKLGGWLESVLQHAENSLDRGVMLCARLALWKLHHESSAALSRHLARNGVDPAAIEEVLQPYWERATQVGAHAIAGVSPGAPEYSLRQSIERLVESWAVCRAVRDAEVEPCNTLLDGQALAECRFLFAKLGILYRHRCQPEKLEEVGRIASQPVDLVERWCHVLEKGRPDELDDAVLATILTEPRDRAAARAVARNDPQACREPSLGEDEQRYCLDELQTYRFVTGSLPRAQWRPPDQSVLFRAAARAARDVSPGCEALAAWAYRYASAPRFLVGEPAW